MEQRLSIVTLGVEDLQRARRPVTRVGNLRLGHRELGRNLADRAIERLALFGQQQAAGMAVEQDRPEALLQRRDLAADRRLAELKSVAGAGEAAVLRDRLENS